ncbi:MAG: hypothetical protein ACTHLL_07610 [Candidatus Nitrosocosmicus sp.]
MSGTYKLQEIGTIEPKVKLVGISKDDKTDVNFKDPDQNFDDNTTKLSFIQTPHIIEIGKRFSNELGRLEYILCEYDKFKLFDLPAEDKIITFVTSRDADNEQIVKTVSEYTINPNKETNQEFVGDRTKDSNGGGGGGRYDNSLQNFILNYIQYMKEFTIASIQMNEKILNSFWKKYNANTN